MDLFKMFSQRSVKTATRKRILYVQRAVFALAIAALFAGCAGCSQCGTGGGEGRSTGALSSVSDFSVVFVDGEAVLYWVDPSDSSLDHIEVSWDPDGGSPVGVLRGLQKLSVPGLDPNKVYNFTVKAVDRNGNVSDTMTGGTGKVFKQRRSPDAPSWEIMGVKGTPIAGQVTLSWTNLDSSEYEYIEITNIPNYGAVQRVPKGAISKTLAGLTNGIEHTFYVSAIDAAGNRKSLVDVGLFVSSHPTSPESAYARSENGSITIAWSDPKDPYLDHLEVVRYPDGEASPNVGKGVETYSFSGLVDDADYELTVYAVDTFGHKRPIGGVRQQTAMAPILPPVRPAEPEVVPPPAVAEIRPESASIRGRPVSGNLRLNWADPSANDIDHIEIAYSPGGPATPVSVRKGVQAHAFSNLSDATEYNFEVSGVSATGRRQAIEGLQLSTPEAPRIAARPTSGEVTITWDDPPDPALSHIELTYRPDGQATPVRVPKGVGRHTFTGLSDNVEYVFGINAVAGDKVQALAAKGATVPQLPVITGMPTDGEIHLSWQDPANVNVDHVEILYTPGGERVTRVARGTENQSFTGLANGVEHAFTVYAVDNAGNRHSVNSAAFYTPQPPPPTVTSVTVSPATATVNQGATQQFVAIIAGTNNPPQTVTWAVTGGATGTSISATGLLTVGANQTPGALTVRATSTIDTSRNGTAAVAVTPPPSVSPTVTSVTVTPATATVSQGATQQFVAIVAGTNNPPQTVTWAVTGGTTGTSISATGLLTIGANQAAGALTIRATSTIDTSRSGTAAVAVPVPAPTVTGVAVSPATATVGQGTTHQFTATVAGANNPPQTVTWAVTGGVTGTSISSTGLLTVGANQAAGTLTVRATSTADASRSGTAAVTVPAPAPTVTGVVVSPATATVSHGTTHQFAAAVAGANNPPQTVTWAVTGGTTGTSISASGLLTVGANQAAGTLTVRATSTADASRSGTAVVTVPAPAPTVTGVAVSPATATVSQGTTHQFAAAVAGANNPPQTVTWAVTGGTTGTSISATGLLTVGANQAAGTLTVRATSTADASRSGTAAVTVPAPAPTVTGVAVSPATVTVSQGATHQFAAAVAGTNNPPQTVTWAVTGGATGTSISATGLLTVGANQAAGTLTVRATSTIDASRSGTAAVTVPAPAPTVTDVAVSPATATVSQGATHQFTATVAGANNPPQTVTWAVTGGATGTSISATGLLTVGANQAAGILTVRATSTADGSRSGTAAVTVTVPAPPPPEPAPSAATPPPEPPPPSREGLGSLTWRASSYTGFGDSAVLTLSYGSGTGRWLAGGQDGKLAYSDDYGVNWRVISDSTFGAIAINAIGYGNGRWIAAGRSGRMAWSANGTSWTAVATTQFTPDQNINAITYSNGRWMAGGSNGTIAWSTDNGASWRRVVITSFGQSSISTIAFSGNRWVAGGTQGKIAYSNDNGLTWTAVANSTFGDADINVIINDKNRWYAGGYGQRAAWSSDGVAWRAITRPFYVLGLAYNGNRWVAGGQDGRMGWSGDAGDNWNSDSGGRNLFGDSWVQVVAYGMAANNWRWIAGGQNGKIIYADEP